MDGLKEWDVRSLVGDDDFRHPLRFLKNEAHHVINSGVHL